ncbi:hypothetical protein CA11_00870 [Gimesia maris]|nr:hypothetical protein CA11_00870 [Gimesia maris]
MVESSVLSEMMVAAFRKRAVRNVVLIDEQFPNLNDAMIEMDEGDSLAQHFKELETARKLYQEFHDQHLLCDVANTRSDWEDT